MSFSFLVVDDDKVFRDIINNNIINFDGNSTIDFSDCGEKAIKKIKKNNYDYVTLDWYLDDMSGLDVIEFIFNESCQEPKVIFISGNPIEYMKGFIFDKIDISKKELIFFMEKPFKEENLQKILNKDVI